jgi:WD40 repeat protein
MPVSLHLLYGLCFVLACAAVVGDQPRLDTHGDPLPDEALARLGTVRLRGTFESVALSPDGKTLAVGDSRGLRLLDVVTGKEVKSIDGPRAFSAQGLAFSPDGKELTKLELPQHAGSLALSGDGKRTAVCGGEQMTVWDLKTARAVRQFAIRRNTQSCFFSPDGKLLAAVSYPMAVQLWETETGKRVGLHEVPDGQLGPSLAQA